MTTTITPQSAFKTAAFYDPNNNTQCIPCEGPKAVPILLTQNNVPNADIVVIDFTQLFQAQTISCIQTCIFTGSVANQQNLVYGIVCNATGMQVGVCNANSQTSGSSFSAVLPIVCADPPKLTVQYLTNTNSTSPFISLNSGDFISLTFLNYVISPTLLFGAINQP